MGVVIEICVKYPVGRTRIRVADVRVEISIRYIRVKLLNYGR